MKSPWRFSVVVVLLTLCCLTLNSITVSAQKSRPPERMKIILDTDIGDDIDDAWALAFAIQRKSFELLGVTVTHDNTPLRARVACKMLHLAGRDDVPVVVGRKTGDSDSTRFYQYAWAEDFELKKPIRKAADDFIIEQVRKYPGQVTIIAVGPLENIADVLRKEPNLPKLVKRVVFMSGCVYRTESSPDKAIAEYNVYSATADAQLVYRAGLPLTIVPLDSTTKVQLKDEEREEVRKYKSPLTWSLECLYRLWITNRTQRMTLHDQLAVAETASPGAFFNKLETLPLVVDDQGFTRIDRDQGKPVTVCLEPKRDEFMQYYIAHLVGKQAALKSDGATRRQGGGAKSSAKTEFEIIEGRFHDGLGTYAEVTLANELISQAQFQQPLFDVTRSRRKMDDAIAALPEAHLSRAIFQQEIGNIERAAKQGAIELLNLAGPRALRRVRHTPREFADAKAGDVALEFTDDSVMPVSVKTDKSGRVAVAEGQTPDIGPKWAERYFRVTETEANAMLRELGFESSVEMKTNYLNVARLVALILLRKLELKNCQPDDFSQAQVGNLAAARYLFRQLVHYKHGNDNSRVIIFDRKTGVVRWESLLEAVNIDDLTSERISFTPARPRAGHPVSTTFGIRIDGRTVVTFQVKHRRGKARETASRYEFNDITTRLEVERI